MTEIETAAGSIIPCAFFGMASVGVLYIVVTQMDPTALVAILCDSGAMGRFVHRVPGEPDKVYEGFTQLVSMTMQPGGAIRCGIRRKYVGE